MSARVESTPGAGRVRWMRHAGMPFVWLAVAVVGASLVALLVLRFLPGAPRGGEWDPTWSYAEVRLPAVGPAAAQALVDEARPRIGERRLEWEPAEEGVRLLLAGPADRIALVGELTDLARARGHATAEIAFGSNLARIIARVVSDPTEALEAARGALPLVLLGGSVVFLALGALLRLRLPREEPRGSLGRRIAAGVALGLVLALVVEGLSRLLAALGHPILEQDWLLEAVERGGPRLWVLLPLVVLLAPLAEEVFFRGYLLPALRTAWGTAGAVLLSSAAFALVHAHGPALPAYFVYGVGLALAARRARSLAVPIAAHVTVNALALALLAWSAHGPSSP